MADLLERLCNADGVSGNEAEVRRIIEKEAAVYADRMYTDSIGNLICFKKGADSSKRVMLAAHMDEVGLIISGITESGFLRFKTVGGIDTRVLVSKRVRVGESKLPGVIGMKAVHLQTAKERREVPKVRDLYIDIGASSEDKAKSLVTLGDYAAFDTKFERLGATTFKAKAIDDRAGCMLLIDALKHGCKYDLYCAFTVQEEVGLRGAATAAYRIKPDAALILEATTCSDVFGCEEKDYVTALGAGAALSFMDRASIADPALWRGLYAAAKRAGIPVQLKRAATGGNDAGAVHLSREGVRCVSLSVPCRYLHSPACIADMRDADAAGRIMRMFLDKAVED